MSNKKLDKLTRKYQINVAGCQRRHRPIKAGHLLHLQIIPFTITKHETQKTNTLQCTNKINAEMLVCYKVSK